MNVLNICAYEENIGRNAKVISLKSITIDELKTKIKNKFRKKPKRIFNEYGTELFDDDIKTISMNDKIVFTMGSTFTSNVQSKNKDITIEIVARNSYIASEAITQLTNV